MPGRAKCPPDCTCEKHNRPRMSLEEQQESQRGRSKKHYESNREAILERQRSKRQDPAQGEAIRARSRERLANLTPEERERRAQLNRDWYKSNPRSPEESKRQHLRHRYGITLEAWEQAISDQDGKCYLCDRPLDFDQPRTIHVDHDHSCCAGKKSCGKCIRGIACDPCNRGVGYFSDDPDLMRRVADNLEAANRRLRTAGA